ncbi:hypothetical protein OEZ86_011924 [Tetradesmus obliquus]|nr:hypothetical protein OEZ86_011924 [Tetradesmus obliquus]
MSSSKASSSSTARAAASALKSGVVLGGTAILSAVNGLTPHMAGAIDIMVVQQPDGSLKCSPFYVRFGKYTPMRSKDKRVQILINGEDASCQMHLGAYGQAYFAAETMEIVSDADDEELLQGMMSPPSGYSSDEGAPYANEEMVSAVQQEVARIKASQEAAAAAAAAAAAGDSGSAAAGADEAAAAALQQQQLVLTGMDVASGTSGSGPLALGLSGFQLSLCGSLLRADMPAGEAQQVFETQRLSAEAWEERGVSLVAHPDLVVKIGGSLYSWQVAAPMVVGMLAFGGRWEHLTGLDPQGIFPIKLADDHSSAAKKAVASSWRLWPFTGWRDAASSSSMNKQLALGGSPPPAGSLPNTHSATAAAAANGLTPAGGSFSNLLSLMGPSAAAAGGHLQDGSSSKQAAPGLDKHAPGSLSAPAAMGAAADGGSPRPGSTVGGSPPRALRRKKHIIIIRKTLTPTSEQLSRLPLRPGSNTITFRASGAADLTAYIYLLRWDTRLVVSDVDGTITRSDLLGHVLPTLGVDWSHPGISQLFHNIAGNGYQIMFLSSRAIAQANITREYLHSLVQEGFKMPPGPVIISPHGLLPSLYREIWVRRPHEFKIACLQDIRALFPQEWNPFYAGFGNRDTDEVSYREVGTFGWRCSVAGLLPQLWQDCSGSYPTL